uniref:Ribonucleotide-triphosphate reductase n=1 Tax=Uncultured archaeon GZfos26G2 TaxID=3386331 RepID=Q64CV2_UNCAG|nr:ribonucleotide-triphosphate reductase [uncultured archaeon GZfos1C11]
MAPNADISLAERIKIKHIFFPLVDGGDIMHIFLGEGYPDPRGIKSLALFFTICLLLSAHKQAL